MSGDFVAMQTRVASELRRSNLSTEIKAAINDAVLEESATRYYFNEVKALTFNTVNGTEYYSDQNMVEIDFMYWLNGTVKMEVGLTNNDEMNIYALGNVTSGQLSCYSRVASQIRLFPIPTGVVSVYMDGYTRLTPTPLAADADTNAWMTEGERLIRARAKSIILRDVIRNMKEAALYEAIADDYKATLLDITTSRISTGTLVGTQF